MTAAQLAQLKYWAEECRATPEDITVAFAMDALRMRNESDDSAEDKVAMTVYALRAFVDKRGPARLSVG